MAVAVVVALPPPVSETAMMNGNKGLKISWGNYRGGSIILNQHSFSFPSMTFTNILAMWYCGDVYINIPPYSMLREKYVMHVRVEIRSDQI